MTKQPTPISEHKDEDVKLLRETLLDIIKGKDLAKKDRIEAAKLLARLHHSLQIDRSITAQAISGTQFKGLKKPELKPELQKRLKGILGVQGN